jgi:hypothetical protein
MREIVLLSSILLGSVHACYKDAAATEVRFQTLQQLSEMSRKLDELNFGAEFGTFKLAESDHSIAYVLTVLIPLVHNKVEGQ